MLLGGTWSWRRLDRGRLLVFAYRPSSVHSTTNESIPTNNTNFWEDYFRPLPSGTHTRLPIHSASVRGTIQLPIHLRPTLNAWD